MILPEKHIRIGESLVGLGGFLLSLMSEPSDMNHLWEKFSKINNSTILPVNHSYDNFILALIYLNIIGVININNRGELYAIN